MHSEDFETAFSLTAPIALTMGTKDFGDTHQTVSYAQQCHAPECWRTQGAGVGLKDGARLDKTRDNIEQAVYYCKKCTYRDPLYNVVRKHIYREHFQHVAAPYLVRPG